MYLNEGGNIWDDAEPFDQAQAEALEKQLEKYLAGTGLDVFRIGSGATPTPGKISGDLDVMVDLDIAAQAFKEQDPKNVRIALEKFLQSKGLETRRIAVTVHVKLPFGDKFHQVDIKVVKNAATVYKFHVHDIPKGSPWKGVNKQMMLNTLASSQGMLWSPDEGLYARDAAGKKAQLLSTDLDEIAQYLLGKGASGKDLGSVESILAAIPDETRRNEIFAKAKASSSWQAATPDVGTNEWFSRTRSKLEMLEETYVLDEGIGDWITKKIDDLLGGPTVSSQQISRAMASAPANIPDNVAEKLVADFLAKKEHEAALERAAQAQRTTVEKLKPYLYYFVGEFIDRWKRIPQADKQRALKDLALGVFRLLMFILEALLKSKR